MKIISWNVNGYRSALSKGLMDYVVQERPDVLCLQETKCQPTAFKDQIPPGYHAFWNPARKNGYSGTAIFVQSEIPEVVCGFGREEHDQEGRVQTADLGSFYLVNVYTPNSKRELLRLDYRVQEWDRAFLDHLQKLRQEKPVVFCGDLNVAHQEIDLANPKANRRNAGFTDEERESFSRLLEAGYIDTFRHFNQEPGQYSWWTYRMEARARNIGWRLDYCVASEELKPRLRHAFIHQQTLGSDHCPVGLELDA